jgi:hypothetical protein
MSPDTGYTMRLENASMGPAHARRRGGQKLTERDKVTYLAHSRVAEQPVSKQMRARKYAGDRPDIGRAALMISADEGHHLACHEELLRPAAVEYAELTGRTLRQQRLRLILAST